MEPAAPALNLFCPLENISAARPPGMPGTSVAALCARPPGGTDAARAIKPYREDGPMNPDVPATPVRAAHATLAQMASLLRDQQARKVDVVAPATAIRARSGQLVIDDSTPLITGEGVTLTAGAYRPTGVCDQGIADKLGIPGGYLRRLREDHPRLYDLNVNSWLERDDRKFLIRCLRPESGSGPGIARAFLSDGYKVIDNLDVIMACLEGIRASGFPVRVDQCDLTDRRMYVRVVCEQVRSLAPALLAGYRSPFTGATGADNPVVFSGFVITNSETGCGAATLTPRLIVQVCDNGLQITKDAIRAVHLGERQDEGVITWSGRTQDKTLELITAKTTDAVRAFLAPEYAERALREIARAAGRPVADPAETVKTVSQKLRYTEAQQTAILDHFIRGGDVTAGGVMHAVTSVAQTLTDPDEAHELEASALRALEAAAA